MTRQVWNRLLEEARDVHRRVARVREFCDFPDDLVAVEVEPRHIPPADLMASDGGLYSTEFARLRDAFLAAGPLAFWRETYRDTDIGDDFMRRFGCYCLIGPGGAWTSEKMAAWVVYMPAHLHYTWHHHPAEELYLVLAGRAQFMRAGEPTETLGPGQVSFHKSMQPHAMETGDDPVMAYVLWRNNLETPPVLTPLDMLK